MRKVFATLTPLLLVAASATLAFPATGDEINEEVCLPLTLPKELGAQICPSVTIGYAFDPGETLYDAPRSVSDEFKIATVVVGTSFFRLSTGAQVHVPAFEFSGQGDAPPGPPCLPWKFIPREVGECVDDGLADLTRPVYQQEPYGEFLCVTKATVMVDHDPGDGQPTFYNDDAVWVMTPPCP